MRILRHFTANDVQFEPFPFKRELSMQAYLVDNEGVLSLDDQDLCDAEIIATELVVKNSGSKNDGDGRIDILASYSQEYYAIIELKLGELTDDHLAQLKGYLKNGPAQISDSLKNDGEGTINRKWIGILVGSSIEKELANKIVNGITDCDFPIAALTIQRFRSSRGDVFVTTDTYFSNTNTNNKDTTNYKFNGVVYGKGRLVLAVIKSYVASNPTTKYADLEIAFPKNCQGSSGVFATLEAANQIYTEKGRKRHFIEPDEVIILADCTIAVSNQWGIGNINEFIEQAKLSNLHVESPSLSK